MDRRAERNNQRAGPALSGLGNPNTLIMPLTAERGVTAVTFETSRRRDVSNDWATVATIA